MTQKRGKVIPHRSPSRCPKTPSGFKRKVGSDSQNKAKVRSKKRYHRQGHKRWYQRASWIENLLWFFLLRTATDEMAGVLDENSQELPCQEEEAPIVENELQQNLNHQFGLLYAAIEAFFRLYGINGGDNYRGYLLRADLSRNLVLDNIASYLMGIHIVNRCSKQKLRFPKDRRSLQVWYEAYHELPKDDQTQLPRAILGHVLDCINREEIEILPEHLEAPILGSQDAVADMVVNNQRDVVGIAMHLQNLAEVYADRFAVAREQNPDFSVFSEEPVITITCEEAQYRRQGTLTLASDDGHFLN